MKINFTKLNVGNDTLKLDVDFGNGFNPVSISTIRENNNSIEIPEGTDISKIKIKGKTSLLKDLDYLKSTFIMKDNNQEYDKLFYYDECCECIFLNCEKLWNDYLKDAADYNKCFIFYRKVNSNNKYGYSFNLFKKDKEKNKDFFVFKSGTYYSDEDDIRNGKIFLKEDNIFEDALDNSLEKIYEETYSADELENLFLSVHTNIFKKSKKHGFNRWSDDSSEIIQFETMTLIDDYLYFTENDTTIQVFEDEEQADKYYGNCLVRYDDFIQYNEEYGDEILYKWKGDYYTQREDDALILSSKNIKETLERIIGLKRLYNDKAILIINIGKKLKNSNNFLKNFYIICCIGPHYNYINYTFINTVESIENLEGIEFIEKSERSYIPNVPYYESSYGFRSVNNANFGLEYFDSFLERAYGYDGMYAGADKNNIDNEEEKYFISIDGYSLDNNNIASKVFNFLSTELHYDNDNEIYVSEKYIPQYAGDMCNDDGRRFNNQTEEALANDRIIIGKACLGETTISAKVKSVKVDELNNQYKLYDMDIKLDPDPFEISPKINSVRFVFSTKRTDRDIDFNISRQPDGSFTLGGTSQTHDTIININKNYEGYYHVTNIRVSDASNQLSSTNTSVLSEHGSYVIVSGNNSTSFSSGNKDLTYKEYEEPPYGDGTGYNANDVVYDPIDLSSLVQYL